MNDYRHNELSFMACASVAGRALNDETLAAEFCEEAAQFDQGYAEMGLVSQHKGLADQYVREGVPPFYARVLAELALATARFDRAARGE